MLFDDATQSVVLKAKDPLYIRGLLPKASKLVQIDGHNIAVRHTVQTTRVLRNIGFQVPSPVSRHYTWPGKYRPFDHQRVMADVLTIHNRVFNLSEMGVGKTYAALWAADYLMSIGEVHKVLICAPLSTLRTVWRQDIFNILMHRTAGIAHGIMEKRLQVFNTDLDFYILNHDGIALPQIAKLIKKRKDIDLIILDEAHLFRNSRNDTYKFLEWILERRDMRFWPMTGTPTPNDPTDAWSLVRLVDASKVPRFFGSFRRQTMINVSPFKWVPRKGAEDIVYNAMQPAVRFKKSECLDLPPVVTIPLQTRLTVEQRTHFKEMKDAMVTQAKLGPIAAVNAADQINKLRQLLCGCIKDPTTGRYVELDHAPRVADLCGVIDSACAKVLVIVPFKGIIRTLEQELSKLYSVGVLNGDVSINGRNRIISDFKSKTDPHLLLCHPKVMAHGLNLTEADTLIFYAPIYSNDEYSQVVERFNRTGQTRKMTIVRMAAHPIEWEIYKMVDTRAITQDNILSLYRQVTE